MKAENDIERIESEIDRVATALAAEIHGVSEFVFSHPELGNGEFASCEFLAGLLEKKGFAVARGYCGLPTAFRAELKKGEGPTIAFLAEYDALPGYGPEKRPAHACGHNWIAASTVGAALILSEITGGFAGTVAVIGTPAEETTGGKADIAAAGGFADVDAAFQMHLDSSSCLNVYSLAIDAWQFDFFGKASHAAKAPEDGINALDAVNLTFAGVGALRQHVSSDVRLHGIVTDGGDAPNVVPARASCRFYARAASRAALDGVSERLKNCARGAALMTGARLEISRFENSFDELSVNRALVDLMRRSLCGAGLADLSDAPELTGSTDLGNVSKLVPTFYGLVGVGDGKSRIHEESFLRFVNSEEARMKAVAVAKAFALSSFFIFSDHRLLEEVSAEFSSRPR